MKFLAALDRIRRWQRLGRSIAAVVLTLALTTLLALARLHSEVYQLQEAETWARRVLARDPANRVDRPRVAEGRGT